MPVALACARMYTNLQGAAWDMKLIAGIAMGILGFIAWAQNDSELTARQLFLITAPAVPQPDATPKKAPAVKVKPVVPPVKKPPADTASTNHQKNSDTSALVVPASYTPLALKYSILQIKGTNYEEVDTGATGTVVYFDYLEIAY